jgi:hypothetical protein
LRPLTPTAEVTSTFAASGGIPVTSTSKDYTATLITIDQNGKTTEMDFTKPLTISVNDISGVGTQKITIAPSDGTYEGAFYKSGSATPNYKYSLLTPKGVEIAGNTFVDGAMRYESADKQTFGGKDHIVVMGGQVITAELENKIANGFGKGVADAAIKEEDRRTSVNGKGVGDLPLSTLPALLTNNFPMVGAAAVKGNLDRDRKVWVLENGQEKYLSPEEAGLSSEEIQEFNTQVISEFGKPNQEIWENAQNQIRDKIVNQLAQKGMIFVAVVDDAWTVKHVAAPVIITGAVVADVFATKGLATAGTLEALGIIGTGMAISYLSSGAVKYLYTNEWLTPKESVVALTLGLIPGTIGAARNLRYAKLGFEGAELLTKTTKAAALTRNMLISYQVSNALNIHASGKPLNMGGGLVALALGGIPTGISQLSKMSTVGRVLLGIGVNETILQGSNLYATGRLNTNAGANVFAIITGGLAGYSPNIARMGSGRLAGRLVDIAAARRLSLVTRNLSSWQTAGVRTLAYSTHVARFAGSQAVLFGDVTMLSNMANNAYTGRQMPTFQTMISDYGTGSWKGALFGTLFAGAGSLAGGLKITPKTSIGKFFAHPLTLSVGGGALLYPLGKTIIESESKGHFGKLFIDNYFRKGALVNYLRGGLLGGSAYLLLRNGGVFQKTSGFTTTKGFKVIYGGTTGVIVVTV